jgi:hypothetical protein
MMCYGFPKEDIRDYLEQRDNIPYAIVQKKSGDFKCTSFEKDLTPNGYIGHVMRQAVKFLNNPTLYLKSR